MSFMLKTYSLNRALFSTELDNMITQERISTGPSVYTYVNVDKAETKGLELELDYDINENHFIKANYTHIKTEDKTTGEELAYKPKNSFNLGLNSELGRGLSSYLSANHIGKQRDSGGETHSSYTLLNAQISKQIGKNLSLRVGVDNIADKSFDDGEPYQLKRRFTYIGLNYKF